MRNYRGLMGAPILGAAVVLMAGSVAPASAADLGGDCCADLEERVAELEATTARKGNRKVSLTVSGWVNENIVWFDDGAESNVYVGTNPVEQSRFRFIGEAKIVQDWSAGYVLEIGVFGGNGGTWNQDAPDGASGSNSLLVRKSSWFLKSKTYGKLTVGQDSTATYHLLDDADTTLTRNFYDGEGAPDYARPFFIRNEAGDRIGTLRWQDVLRGFTNSTPGDSGRRNIVRYDTPTFAGFSLAATWGEDDMWDMAAIYTGQLGDFKVNGRAGYGSSGDGIGSACHGTNSPTATSIADDAIDCEWWGVSGMIQHTPTGLFVFAGYGDQNDGSNNPAVEAALLDNDSRTWFVQAGIEQKWIPLGKTNFFGEYRRDEAGSNVSLNAAGTPSTVTQEANVNFWAIGAAQNIEAADMTFYLVYQHVDGDVTVGRPTAGANPTGTSTDIDSLQQVIAGAKINF
jgi:predicted porin